MIFAAGCLTVVFMFMILMSALAWSRRIWQLPLEACRKITHVAMGLACLSFPLFVASTSQAVCLASLFIGILGLMRLKPELLWGGGELLPASRCESEGEFYFVAGIAIVLLFARETWAVYLACVLTLTFADSAAAVVGRWIGKRHCWGNAKTMEGSLAFCLVGILCLAGPVFLLGQGCDPFLVAAVCVLATVAEGVAGRGSDNLWIPLVCVLGFQLPHWMANATSLIAIFATATLALGWVAFRKLRAAGKGADSRFWRCDANQQESALPSADRQPQRATGTDEES